MDGESGEEKDGLR